MPLIRYDCTLSPDALRHPTAFAPVPASTIAKYANFAAQGQTVTGAPGTRQIRAPRPWGSGAAGQVAAAPGSVLPGGAGGGMAGGSGYAPEYWYPSLYYATQRLWGAIGGVMVYSNNAPPVPTAQATGTTQVPGMLPRRAQRLRDRQVAMPPNAPRWQRWRGRDARESVTTHG